MKSIIIPIVLLFTLASCNSYKYGVEETTNKSNLTIGMVKSKIAKGSTKQDEIVEIFGSPNLVSKNKSNLEVWSYNKMSVEQRAGRTNFFSGQRASQSSNSKSFDLIITFDENDTVKDYSVISTSY
ncbi:hypothetical protein M8998_14775 [Sphingobacterium sp. lm-10]|uniref:hypothetical protein n=1 Tax=Sphingobacterium sp. lm-10 TaxID=2944904 RepID=UPI00202029A0|nr:hypothetical protein [Sphingobacterium sp. lm-10]MCL7989211.1 hypothetical protein [Sphingobacterium sp. lm-10]